MEQMAAILLGAYLVTGLFLFKEKKKLHWFYFVQLGLILLSIVFILTTPGNSVRIVAETERFFPEFAALSFLEKLWTGFLETGQYYLAAGPEQESLVFGLLTGVLFRQTVLLHWGRGKKWYVYAAALCPLAFYWGLGHLGSFLLDSGILTRGRNGVGVLVQNKYIPELSYFSAGLVAMQTLCYLLVICCVLLTIWFLYGKSREAALQSVILAAGFLSKMIVGFSPTVYASGDRTSVFGAAAILIVVMRNLLLLQENQKKKPAMAAALAYIGVCVWMNLAQ